MAVKKKTTKTANKAIVATYGKVRVETHKGGYRVRRYDRAKKTTVDVFFTKDQEEAIKKAMELAHHDAVHQGAQADTATITVLGEKVLDPNLHLSWTAGTRANWESLFRQHIANVSMAKPNGAKPIGNRLARDLTAADLGQFIRDKAFKEDYSASMLSKMVQFFGMIAEEAVAAGIWNAAKNPVTGLTVPEGAGGKEAGIRTLQEAEIPTDDQVKALRDALAAIDIKYAIMCDIASHCGLRLGELLALQQDDISIKNRTIHVQRQVVEETGRGFVKRKPKTKAGTRTVIIPKAIMPALRAYHRKKKTGELMFCDSAGGYLYRSNFNQVLNGRISNGKRKSKGAFDAAGWPKSFTWHTLRHYAITTWLKAGINVVDCSEMAGHSSVETTLKQYVGTDRKAASRALKHM